MKALFYADTNIGRVRTNNEDRYVAKSVWSGSHILAVAIDGVGGADCGEVAAQTAATCISEHIDACPNKAKSLDVLQAAVIYANNTIHAHRGSWSKMCCVLTAALIDLGSGQVDICHIGDTRLYTYIDGVLRKVTVDHSVVSPYEQSGRLTEYEAMHHPLRNQITRAVGSNVLQWGTEYVQCHTLNLSAPCTIMLCSDGLYDLVHSSEITPILASPTSVNQRVEMLIGAALKAGGKDNITVIVIDLIE